MTLEATVRELLDTVVDPCSARMGAPRGLVGMGLVQAVAIEPATIRVSLVLTGPGCFYYFQFADAIERALESVAGGRSIEVDIDERQMWTPERMRPAPIRIRNRH